MLRGQMPCGASFGASRAEITARQLRPHSGYTRIGSQQSPAQDSRPLFNRDNDAQELLSLRLTTPSHIHVVLGPRSCGKSRLLTNFQQQTSKVFYADCRQIDTTEPSIFISELIDVLAHQAPKHWGRKVLKAAAQLLTGIKIGGKITIDGRELAVNAENLAKLLALYSSPASPESKSLSALFATIRLLLTGSPKAGKNAQEWPVLIIDEANALMPMRRQGPEKIKELLDFLVAISKQDRSCHVLLVTSEYAFQAWLQQEIGPFWRPVVIGDFEEQDARGFLEWELRREGVAMTVDDATWQQVYEVCGGNAGALVVLVSMAKRSMLRGRELNWQTGLRHLYATQYMRNQQLAKGGDGYTSAHFAAAALKLLESKHHAVPQKDIEVLLGQITLGTKNNDIRTAEAGTSVLWSLVAANALSIRPLSDWATDSPDDTFQIEDMLVTAPSSIDLFCLRKMKPDLERIKKDGLANGLSMQPSLPVVDDKANQVDDKANQIKSVNTELQGLQKQLADVQNDIRGAQERLAIAKEDGSKEEVAALRRELEQLRDEKKQLLEQQTILLRQRSNHMAGS